MGNNLSQMLAARLGGSTGNESVQRGLQDTSVCRGDKDLKEWEEN